MGNDLIFIIMYYGGFTLVLCSTWFYCDYSEKTPTDDIFILMVLVGVFWPIFLLLGSLSLPVYILSRTSFLLGAKLKEHK